MSFFFIFSRDQQSENVSSYRLLAGVWRMGSTVSSPRISAYPCRCNFCHFRQRLARLAHRLCAMMLAMAASRKANRWVPQPRSCVTRVRWLAPMRHSGAAGRVNNGHCGGQQAKRTGSLFKWRKTPWPLIASSPCGCCARLSRGAEWTLCRARVLTGRVRCS